MTDPYKITKKISFNLNSRNEYFDNNVHREFKLEHLEHEDITKKPERELFFIVNEFYNFMIHSGYSLPIFVNTVFDVFAEAIEQFDMYNEEDYDEEEIKENNDKKVDKALKDILGIINKKDFKKLDLNRVAEDIGSYKKFKEQLLRNDIFGKKVFHTFLKSLYE